MYTVDQSQLRRLKRKEKKRKEKKRKEKKRKEKKRKEKKRKGKERKEKDRRKGEERKEKRNLKVLDTYPPHQQLLDLLEALAFLMSVKILVHFLIFLLNNVRYLYY